jgi:hypothetical protein
VAASLSNPSATIVSYSEGMQRGSLAFGGCSTFQTAVMQVRLALLPGTLVTNKVTFVDWPLMSLTATNFTCRSNATALVSSYYSATTSMKNISCDGNVWRSRKCSNGKLALCVGCRDPCSLGCNDIDYLNTCSSKYSSCTSVVNGYLRVLSVAMLPLVPPPSANITNVVVTSTTSSFYVHLSSTGSFYVGIYDSSSAPTSTSDIVAQNLQYSVVGTNAAVYVSFTGLVPAMRYSVYIVTKAKTGATMVFSDSLKTKTSFNTTCCRPISVSLSSLSITQGSSLANALSLSVATRPTHNITVQLFVNSTVSASYKSLFPASVVFSSQAKVATSASASVLATSTKNVSTLNLYLKVTGPDAALYQVVYSNGNQIKVLSSTAQPSPPSVNYVRFSNDGTFLRFGFSTPTNLAGISAKQFACNRVVNFTGVGLATCVWTSSTQLSASLGSTATVSVGNYANVLGGKVKATCPSRADCSKWNTTSSASVKITSPTSALLPSVSLRAPSMVGICDQILLDSSSSTGSAGRSWKSSSFSVQSSSGSVTSIQSFLNNNYTLSPPTPISKSYLFASTFTFVLTLCNFLGSCSSSSAVVSVVDSSIPSVTIFGNPVSQINRKNAFSLQADAYVASCDSTSKDRTGLSYAWSVVDTTGATVNVVSNSRQKTVFSLAAFTLSVNYVYTVTFTATDDTSFTSSSTSVQVQVGQGAIIVVLAGGATRGIIANSSVVLDASSTYDEDYGVSVKGSAAGLSFSWSCLTTSPTLLSSCALTLGTDTSSGTLKVYAAFSAVGTTSTITVTAFDSSRSVSSSVALTALDVAAPSVAVSSTLTTKLNPFDKLYLVGSIKAVSTVGCAWSISDTTVDLSSVSLTGTSKQVPGSSATTSYNLVLAAGGLVAGSQYSFTLSCTTQGGTAGFASFAVVTNSPPSPGTFSVSPKSGVELQDPFTFAASQWIDSDIPLTYAFGFLSVTGVLQQVQSQSQLNYGTTVLPAGLDSLNYTVTCSAIIYDSLNANSSSSASAHVSAYAGSYGSLQSLIASQISSSAGGTVDQSKQAIASCGASLNSVACSRAPNCTVLHRNKCSSTANTCGSCLSGFVGVVGDSNSACASTSSSSSFAAVRRMASCITDSDCDSFQYCVSSTCVAEAKNCTSNCNDRGLCAYVLSHSGANLTTCDASDPLCSAVCLCNSSFAGPACEYTADQMAAKQSNRASLLSSLYSVTQQEDSSATNVVSWLSSLVSLAQSEYELTPAALETAQLVAATICESAASLSLDYSVIETILSVVDSLASRVAISLYVTDYESDAHNVTQHSQNVVNILSSFTDVLFTGMIEDQLDVQYYFANFHFVASVTSLTSDTTATLALSEPQSGLDSAYTTASTANLTLTANNQGSALRFMMVVVSAAVYGLNAGSLNSNPILLLTDNSTACNEDSSCGFSYYSPNNSPQSYLGEEDLHTEMFYCERGVTTSVFFDCPNGLNMTGTCDGVFVGWVNITCPHYVSYPACVGFNEGEVIDYSSCEYVSYGADSTQCECSMDSASSSSSAVLTANARSRPSFQGWGRRLTGDSWGSLLGNSGAQFVSITNTVLQSASSSTNTFMPSSMPTSQPTFGHGSFEGLMGHYADSLKWILIGVFVPVCVVLIGLAIYVILHKRHKRQQSSVAIDNLNIDWKGIFKESKGEELGNTANPQKEIDLKPKVGSRRSSSSSSSTPSGDRQVRTPRSGSARGGRGGRSVTFSPDKNPLAITVNMNNDPVVIFQELDQQVELNVNLSRQAGEVPRAEPARVRDLRTSSEQRALRQAEITYLRRLIREYKGENDRIESSLAMSTYLSSALNLQENSGGTESDIDDELNLFPLNSNSPSSKSIDSSPAVIVMRQADLHPMVTEMNMDALLSGDEEDADVDITSIYAPTAGTIPNIANPHFGTGAAGADGLSSNAGVSVGSSLAIVEPRDVEEDDYADVGSIFQTAMDTVDDSLFDFNRVYEQTDRVPAYDPSVRDKRRPPPRPPAINIRGGRGSSSSGSPNRAPYKSIDISLDIGDIYGGDSSVASPARSEMSAGSSVGAGAGVGIGGSRGVSPDGAHKFYRTSSAKLQQQAEAMLARHAELEKLAARSPIKIPNVQTSPQRLSSRPPLTPPSPSSSSYRDSRKGSGGASPADARSPLKASPSNRRVQRMVSGRSPTSRADDDLVSRSADVTDRAAAVESLSGRSLSRERSARAINAATNPRPNSASSASPSSATGRGKTGTGAGIPAARSPSTRDRSSSNASRERAASSERNPNVPHLNSNNRSNSSSAVAPPSSYAPVFHGGNPMYAFGSVPAPAPAPRDDVSSTHGSNNGHGSGSDGYSGLSRRRLDLTGMSDDLIAPAPAPAVHAQRAMPSDLEHRLRRAGGVQLPFNYRAGAPPPPTSPPSRPNVPRFMVKLDHDDTANV